MANIIVVPFKEETKAIEALHKIKELDAYGDITLFEHMMIRKKDNNQYEVLKDTTDEEGWRTFTGMALGGLVGAFAGPLGLIIGLYTGTAAGAVWDISRYDFEDEFIKKISNKMNAGTIAIIAEVGEDSSVFIDDALKSYGSEIMRSDAEVAFDDYVDDQIEDLEDDIEDEREKLKKATAEEKVKIKAKIADLKAKRKAKISELDAKRKSILNKIKEKTNARINKLESRLESFEDSISDSITQAKAKRIEKRIKKQKSKLSKLSRELEEVLL
jgi:uncharacterized membrane protein